MMSIEIQTQFGRRVLHPGDRMLIGRARECDLVMTDLSVSKRHAVIHNWNGELYVMDAGSRNGTRLNRLAVRGMKRLRRGSWLRLGDAELLVLVQRRIYVRHSRMPVSNTWEGLLFERAPTAA